MSFRDTVKPYFVTGAFPTQQQFWDLLDKIQFKDESGTRISKIGVAQIPIPADTWVDKIAIVTSAAITVSCGTVNGSNDVLDSEQVQISQGFDIPDIHFPDAGNLFFSGILPDTEIIIFTR